LTPLGIRGDIGVSGNRKEVNMAYETHIVHFVVIVNLCVGSVGAGERVIKLELYDRRGVEWSAVLASILAPEIGFLQFYELCAHMLSSKLAGGKVEGCANGSMRRLGWWIAFPALLGG
jgi:hypothetical protein